MKQQTNPRHFIPRMKSDNIERHAEKVNNSHKNEKKKRKKKSKEESYFEEISSELNR